MQGQSLSTLDKERQIAAMLSMQKNILSNKPTILGSMPYFHIDLNAGCGYNKQFRVPGSPLVFLNEMFDFPFRAWFIERNPKATDELKLRLRAQQNIEICNSDNREALVYIANRLPTLAVGSILADPNTWAYRNARNGNGIPLEELRIFCSRFRRMDLLMNLNTRVFSMMDATNRNGGGLRYQNLLSLETFPSFFQRAHWLISYSHNGHTGFVRLTGRNMRTNDYAKWGWYHWDSPQGQRIRENIRTRKKDRESGQLEMFKEALP